MIPFAPQSPRFRMLPLVLVLMALLFVAKAYDIYLVGEAIAAEEKVPEEEGDKKEADAKKDDAEEAEKKDEAAADGEKKEEGETKDEAVAEGEKKEGGEAAAEGEHAEGEAKKEGEHGEGEKKEGEGKKEAKAAPPPVDILAPKKQYSPTEVELLESLSARRDQLDKWEADVKMKESLLGATEKRLDRKVAEMQAMEGSLKKLVDSYNQHQDTEIKSLVKLYENMKPANAAAIFNEMDMPILVLVVDKMSERKAAPVLAAMSPVKAKDLTIQLAAERKARDDLLQQQSQAPAQNLSSAK